MRNLITAQEVIDLAFAENSNMMAESISETSIHIAEIKYIRPAFGVMYPLLADKYADFTNDYVKPALAYFVKCEIVSSIAIDMSNSGVAVANPQYQSAATDKQRQRLYDSEMSKAKTLLDFALEYIAENKESFPDFSGEAPKKHHRVGGILLGGGTSRSQSASIAGEAFKNEIERLSKKVEDLEEQIGSGGGQNKDFMPATPSGDPMHYAYEAIGAQWNANTGFWEFYDMKDITNAEMSKALARGSWYIGATAIGVMSAFNEQSPSAIRFNIARTGPWSVSCDFDYFAQENKWIEFINLTCDNNMASKPFSYASSLTGSFNGCSNLRRIYGEINVVDTKNAFTDTFKGCVKLEEVEIYGLNKDISFADSPLLSKESLLYMIENCAESVSFTITLHPDVYEKCSEEWMEDIDSAVGQADTAKQTNITLAKA